MVVSDEVIPEADSAHLIIYLHFYQIRYKSKVILRQYKMKWF